MSYSLLFVLCIKGVRKYECVIAVCSAQEEDRSLNPNSYRRFAGINIIAGELKHWRKT